VGPQVFIRFGDSEDKYSAEIQNLSAYSIKFWMKRKSETGARVRMEFSPGFHQTGTVLYCKQQDIGCITVVDFDKDSTRELRSEMRVAFTETALVTELGLRKPVVLNATTIDLSASGISLRTARALRIGALVEIELRESLLFAEVRNCQRDSGTKFRVGLSIERQIAR
jgi:hypothetical protein